MLASNAPSAYDGLRARAQAMVRNGEARSFSHACSLLSRRAAAARRKRAAKAKRLASAWWTRYDSYS